MKKRWEERALSLLEKSLNPVPSELNEIDWKNGLSDNKEKLTKHICAFSHLRGGGFLAYGIDNNGQARSLGKEEIEQIVQRISSIARNSLTHPITIDHSIIDFKGESILLVHIEESKSQPNSFRNDIFDCYKRSGGSTVKMSVNEVKFLIAQSQGIVYEELIAKENQTAQEVIGLLTIRSYYELQGLTLPTNVDVAINKFVEEGFINDRQDGTFDITNLGAILFARKLTDFKNLARKSIRVIQYSDVTKIKAIKETTGLRGYASGFTGLIQYITDILPSNEVIETAIRTQTKMYPVVALREFIANALIHQDFTIEGAGVTIEIYPDRIEITNPGTPLIDPKRFIDAAPRSRNELLATKARRLNICEERGSGIDRALNEIEAYQLPAPKFEKDTDYTRITMYAHKELKDMDKEDKIRACYQHCCLQYVSNQKTTNQSLRHRFNISDSNYPMASKIFSETIAAGLIKPADPQNDSKKHTTYIPFWA